MLENEKSEVPTQIIVHNGTEIEVTPELSDLLKQTAALAAQEALKGASLAANATGRSLGLGVRAAATGSARIVTDTIAEVKHDLKTDPKRFRIGVQRMVFACGLTGFICLFIGVAIGLGDPAHTANQSAPGVNYSAQVEALAEEEPVEAPAE